MEVNMDNLLNHDWMHRYFPVREKLPANVILFPATRALPPIQAIDVDEQTGRQVEWRDNVCLWSDNGSRREGNVIETIISTHPSYPGRIERKLQ